MKLNPLNSCDFYKVNHRSMYPDNTQVIYSNFTPRSIKLAKMLPGYDGKIVSLGLQGFIKEYLIETFNDEFFNQPKEKVVAKYKRRMDTALGPGAVEMTHIEELHDLGYLPLEIKALPEGSRVDIKIPLFTVKNTDPKFFWLTNYLETVMSNSIWKSTTLATIAYEYRKVLEQWAKKTGAPLDFVMWQGHDFSDRGMSGPEDAARSSLGHLTCFAGTDTISCIDYAEDYYNANADTELIGGSVPATEHSVMCAGGFENEIDTFRRLMKLHPTGVLSVVSDTWDFWKVMTEYTVTLKQEILDRQPNALGLAKLVFRPDSGDPVKIVCGDSDAPVGSPEYKGAIQCLYDVFGGTKNTKGFIELNPRVGLIYGDSITLERADAILKGLADKGFASSNVVFGIGSFTYQYMTRDTLGFAMKATYSEVNGQSHNLYKDPKTGDGVKKSAKGLLRVELENNEYVLYDQQTKEQEENGCLTTVFKDGIITKETSLSEIRERINKTLR